MSVKTFISVAVFAAVTGLVASVASAITIPTVPIGNPGNAADPTTGYGSVGYAYNIGTTEVTNAQYAAFLNAVARTDTNNLYNTEMAGSFGGITRSNGPGDYSYATVPGRENNPVNFVSFWDSCRFANWLTNDQPTGAQNNATTEDGAYALTPSAISGNTVARKVEGELGWKGSMFAVASEDEWYKAAYHGGPAAQVGIGANGYWLYPTSSNSINTSQANYNNVIGNNTVPVGSYAANFYGTFDMGGNVWEWNEAIIFESYRGFRGGSLNVLDHLLRADYRNNDVPRYERNDIGFRVSQVPGPSSIALLVIGGLAAARRRRS